MLAGADVEDTDARPTERGVRSPATTPPDTTGFHLSNLELERLFFEARNQYIAGVDIDDVWHRPVVPVVRELVTRFESEARGGADLECSTRVTSRSRRAFVMQQSLIDRSTGTVAATCRSVHVTVGADGPVEIPTDLWTAIERRDGGTIPQGSSVR